MAKRNWRSRVKNSQFEKWMDEPVLSFDDIHYTRRQIVDLTASPCVAAAINLERICSQYGINSVTRLNVIGMLALRRCRRAGERTTLIAAYILHEQGFDVDTWMDKEPSDSWLIAVRKASRRAARRRHPAA